MPQMAPMSWLTLMLMFILTLITMMTLNYFMIQPYFPKKTTFKHMNSSMNWKW